MSINHGSPSRPLVGVTIDTYSGSQSPTPRASWHSKNSARTWTTAHHYPHKAPPLQPVLTTASATRTPSPAEQPIPYFHEEHMTIDADGPYRESILGARRVDYSTRDKSKEERKSIVGSFIDGLKLVPRVLVGGHGNDRRQNSTANAGPTVDLTATNGRGFPMGEVEMNGESEHVETNEPLVNHPTSAPQTYPHRNYDSQSRGTHRHDVHDSHIYHFPRPHPKANPLVDGQSQTRYTPGPGDIYHHSHREFGTPAIHFESLSIGGERGGSPPDAFLQEQGNPYMTPLPPPVRTDSASKTRSQSSTRRRLLAIHKFLKSLYHLPWISSRITADYEPRGWVDGHRPIPWYSRRRYSLDLLSSGESLPTIPTTNRHDRTMMSSTSPSSPQMATTNRRRTQRVPSHLTHTPPPSLDDHQNLTGIRRAPEVSARQAARHKIQRHHSTKPSTSKKERRHKPRTASDLDHSQSRKAHSRRSPERFTPFPYNLPPQPLFIMAPPSSPYSARDRAEIRQAVPVYVLAPNPTTVVPWPQEMTQMPEPARVRTPGPSEGPTPVSSNRSHRQ